MSYKKLCDFTNYIFLVYMFDSSEFEVFDAIDVEIVQLNKRKTSEIIFPDLGI